MSSGLVLAITLAETGSRILGHSAAVTAVEAGLAPPLIAWAGWPHFARAWSALSRRCSDRFILTGIGVLVATAAGLFGTVVPGALHWLRTTNGNSVPYFVLAASFMAIALLAELLDHVVANRTGAAAGAPIGVGRKHVRRLLKQGGEEDVLLTSVAPGECLRIRPGETIPADGTVTEGRSTVDEAPLTGESMAVDKGTGARVLKGTLNGKGTFVMRAEAVGNRTTLSQIAERARRAERALASISDRSDAIGRVFLVGWLAGALLIFAVRVASQPYLGPASVDAIALTVIACPAALSLALSLPLWISQRTSASLGVFFRSNAAIETFALIDTLVIEPSGTIMTDRPSLLSVLAADGFGEADVVRLAAAVESDFENGEAAAIVREAVARGLEIPTVDNAHSGRGQGHRAVLSGRQVRVVRRPLLEPADAVVPSGFLRREDEMRRRGETVLYVVSDGALVGMLGMRAPLRAWTPEAVRCLRDAGIRVVLMSSEDLVTSTAIAREAGIDEVIAGVAPERKTDEIKRLQGAGRLVAMVANGMHDVSALANAHIGIVMGTGTEAARAIVGVRCMKCDPFSLVRARLLAAATLKVVKQSILLAMALPILGALAAFGPLHPVLGSVSPIIAAVVLYASSLAILARAREIRRAVDRPFHGYRAM